MALRRCRRRWACCSCCSGLCRGPPRLRRPPRQFQGEQSWSRSTRTITPPELEETHGGHWPCPTLLHGGGHQGCGTCMCPLRLGEQPHGSTDRKGCGRVGKWVTLSVSDHTVACDSLVQHANAACERVCPDPGLPPSRSACSGWWTRGGPSGGRVGVQRGHRRQARGAPCPVQQAPTAPTSDQARVRDALDRASTLVGNIARIYSMSLCCTVCAC